MKTPSQAKCTQCDTDKDSDYHKIWDAARSQALADVLKKIEKIRRDNPQGCIHSIILKREIGEMLK